LTFIDPHGLRNERDFWDSSKIMLFKKLKEEIQPQVNNKKLVLNSFVLQPPPGFRDARVDKWHRDDDPLNQIELHEYARSRNVFEIPTEGTRSGPNGYIDLMVRKILGLD